MEIDLRIIGPAEQQTRHKTIREGDIVRVGRSPATGIEIPWDRRISREQADLYFDGERLHIKCLEEARNPVLCGRRAYREVSLHVGDEFRIGETRFTVRESEASTRDSLNQQFDQSVPEVVVENAYSSQELGDADLPDAVRQLEILASLPELISTTQSDGQLIRQIVPLLLEGIPLADGAVFAEFDSAWLDEGAGPEALTRPVALHVETRPGFEGQFRPSRRLILKALRQQQSLVHIWGRGETGQQFTVSDGLGWAYCVPFQHATCPGWCLFVAGRVTHIVTSDDAIRGDIRFTELLTQFIAAARQVRQTQDRKARLSTVFSPAAVHAITAQDTPDVAAPVERDMTALVCDIQGLDGATPAHSLRELIESVRETLSIVVSGILDRDGAITDFRADSALGIWGWPMRFADGPVSACQSALDISRSLCDEILSEGRRFEGITIGIGIAHGEAIAGGIGPAPQTRMGVYGPAVTRGSVLARVASRQFGVAICMDDITAGWAQLRLKKSVGRIRRLARVRLGQQDEPRDLFALLPPLGEAPGMTEAMIGLHDSAIDAVIDGQWEIARELLSQLPQNDGPARFLLSEMANSADRPPTAWDGAFTLS